MQSLIKVTPDIYEIIKKLLAGGATQAQCAKAMKLSAITIGRISRSDSYDAYKQTLGKSRACDPKPQKEPDEQTEILKQILEKLTIIVDQLT